MKSDWQDLFANHSRQRYNGRQPHRCERRHGQSEKTPGFFLTVGPPSLPCTGKNAFRHGRGRCESNRERPNRASRLCRSTHSLLPLYSKSTNPDERKSLSILGRYAAPKSHSSTSTRREVISLAPCRLLSPVQQTRVPIPKAVGIALILQPQGDRRLRIESRRIVLIRGSDDPFLD